MTHDGNGRFEESRHRLAAVVGEVGESLVGALSGIAPDFGRQMIEFSYVDIYGDPRLDLRSREMVALASIATLGHAPRQLKVHVQGALNTGCSPAEIVQVVSQIGLYAGLPAATNALLLVEEVFKEKGIGPSQHK